MDDSIDPNRKVAINVWYRHVLIAIYPLSPMLIVGSLLAGISIYIIAAAMIIPFIIMTIMGYVILLRPLELESEEHERDLKKVFYNLIPIIVAPIIDLIGRIVFNLEYPEIFLLIGLTLSIWLALLFSKMPIASIKSIAQKMRIWRFPLLIIAIFLFLAVFIRSGLPEDIGSLKLPFIIFIFLGFILGYATGRVQLPLSILVPIYLVQNSVFIMPLIDFIFIYWASFLGYIVTPVHPCVAYSVNYFKVDYKNVLKFLALPTFTCFAILLGFYGIAFFIG
ncbi:MAG: DUF401 family protein [Promethearchaeota archaeon]|nr:MAG: DUF401 family protein [Candidatus Lokiarchaeota archaeon]